jgi:hypothetical protein
MEELWLNGAICDIDDKTIIGFELQSYDIKDPGKPKVKISNNFTIPTTSKNKLITGFAGNPQSDTNTIYEKVIVKYIVDNEIIIEDARARFEKISDRIELFIYQKNDVWDVFKITKLSDISADLVGYLCLTYGYPTEAHPADISLTDFLDYFTTKKGLYLTYYFGNLASYRSSGTEPYWEAPNSITLNDSTKQGGHLSLFLIDFFRFLEYKYDIDFQIDTTFKGNIFKDEYMSKVYTPFQQICIDRYYDQFFLRAKRDTDSWPPIKNIGEYPKSDKTIYDLITSFFKHFNVLMDYVWIDGTFVTRLYRFDDLDTKAPVINWSGSLKGEPIFIPIISGWAQETLITFKKVYEGGNPELNSKKILVANENIEANATITEIDAYVNSFTLSTLLHPVPLLSSNDALDSFSFFIDGTHSEDVTVYSNSDFCTKILVIPALYALTNEYNLLSGMMNRPKVYEVERWMKTSDIRNLLFFAEYFIEELGGAFFINKISGFNPAKKNTTAKIQLIKSSDRTPVAVFPDTYWKDGKENIFVDGSGNYFIY